MILGIVALRERPKALAQAEVEGPRGRRGESLREVEEEGTRIDAASPAAPG
jgi:hypothetical protein